MKEKTKLIKVVKNIKIKKKEGKKERKEENTFERK